MNAQCDGSGGRVAILGCGTVGLLTARLLVAQGRAVVGVRRQPPPPTAADPAITMLAGDAADPAVLEQCGPVAAVLLCASPGLRRGRDNGLARIATAVTARWPDCRFVYTGSTAVYADLAGGDADEDALVASDDPAVAGLLAIERAVLRHPDALVLRATALVGPERTHARERIAAGQGTVTVGGELDRPFSWLHDEDLAELAAAALDGAWGCGILNAAAPGRISLRDYYQHHAAALGLVLDLRSDGRPAPRRRIDARRLHRLCGPRRWRGLGD
jgi:nucleoside-diphosphate-sugar epimerase